MLNNIIKIIKSEYFWLIAVVLTAPMLYIGVVNGLDPFAAFGIGIVICSIAMATNEED